ncbi:ActR/RegA family two-component response regulator [Bradyrhizobium ottawaense]
MTEQGETGEPITILLVEDDAPTCWRLQDALVKAGYEVRSPPARSAKPVPRLPAARPACC